jgi:hypothetical protein
MADGGPRAQRCCSRLTVLRRSHGYIEPWLQKEPRPQDGKPGYRNGLREGYLPAGRRASYEISLE